MSVRSQKKFGAVNEEGMDGASAGAQGAAASPGGGENFQELKKYL